MFDVDFSKLFIIATVALVVIGPARLPKMARTAGHLFRRMQRYINDVKTDISREMQLDELKKLQSEMKESALGLQRDISGELQSAQQAVDTATQFIVQEVAAPPSDAMEVGTPRAVEPVERVERIEPVAADLAASPAVKA